MIQECPLIARPANRPDGQPPRCRICQKPKGLRGSYCESCNRSIGERTLVEESIIDWYHRKPYVIRYR
jgi:hypothetical protein